MSTTTVKETPTSMLEITPRGDGSYELTVHSRPEDRDRWDDLSIELEPAAIGKLIQAINPGWAAIRMESAVGNEFPNEASYSPEQLEQQKLFVERARSAERELFRKSVHWTQSKIKFLLDGILAIGKEDPSVKLKLSALLNAFYAEVSKDPMPGSAPRSARPKIDVREIVAKLAESGIEVKQ